MLEHDEKLIAQLKGELEALRSQAKEFSHDLAHLNTQLLTKDDLITELQAKL